MGKKILIVGEIQGGALRKTSLEVLSAGRAVAEKSSGSVDAALVGSGIDAPARKLAAHGVAVKQVDGSAYASYSPETYAEALTQLVRQQGYDVVLFADTSMGKDVAPRVATRLDAGLVTDVVQLDLAEDGNLRVVHPIFTGKVNAEFLLRNKAIQVLSLRPHTYPAATEDGSAAAVEKVEIGVEKQPRAVVKEVVAASGGTIELTEADVIVAGGRSLKSEENFKVLFDLADVLGAAVGASRAAVDAGYQPHSQQVGQTGKVVNPTLYFACGISGAIQHLVGMRTSKVIVAINKDANAPIFQNADYGIVGDLFEVVPLLTGEFKTLLGRE
ncbi:MAG: electron transfer flavoprotein subunit alpha/FixB family protein [Candidatus Latescibacterota bacterium]|nr:MAG: electron transfer flavoprotein subunit alpha/FixB family protein [Candidatus Latescibacterota bacterium]